jgi:serine/threonine protein phosphatase PrpC
MNDFLLNVHAAIEPPAGLRDVYPSQGNVVLRSGDATAVLVTDGSASWGHGVEAAAVAAQRLARLQLSAATTIADLAVRLEEAAFQAEEELSAKDPDADSLFSGTMALIQKRDLSLAWAGDVLLALWSNGALRWLNYPNHHAARIGPSADAPARPSTWYPGLLGCSRAQRAADLSTFGHVTQLADDDVLFMFTETIWSKLNESDILEQIRAASTLQEAWQPRVSEALLRIAKQRGARGHRASVALWLAPRAISEAKPWARPWGYRAVSVSESGTVTYAVEERGTGREIVRIGNLTVHDQKLLVSYEIVSGDLNQATVSCLIFELVLEGLLGGKFRDVKEVLYADSATGIAKTLGYSEPHP